MSASRPIQFEWDENKSRINLRKHRVSFDEAKSVFHYRQARLIPDPDHSVDEERFILLGMSDRLRILVVCHCYRASDSMNRIINARKAGRSERTTYEELRK